MPRPLSRSARFLSSRALVFGALALLSAAATLDAYGERRPPASTRAAVPAQASDSAAVVATVEAFHRALAQGDSAAALALLTDDVEILESGGAETRADYRRHHLPADIAFARAVPSVRGPARVAVRGEVAWVTSTSTTQGEFRGRSINSAGAELVVLTRAPGGGGWKITAIHWSSRNRRRAAGSGG